MPACWGLVHGLAMLGLDEFASAQAIAPEKVLEMFLQGLSVANRPHNHLSAGAKPS